MAAPRPDPDQYLSRAKVLAARVHNRTSPPGVLLVDDDDMYICWFSKTLQNWKATVSTDVVDGLYWEVTHNGDKGETYVDQYVKQLNVCFPD